MEETLTIVQMIVLAVVQGATEFIPVSSSGHLVLVRELLGWSDENGVVVDIILHASSLLAVILYFRKDWVRLYQSYFSPSSLAEEDRSFYRLLPGLLILATIPIVIIAPPFEDALGSVRKLAIVAAIMMGTALWFLFCEQFKRRAGDMTWKTSLFMGCVQVVALLPGASRSGLTTGAGVLCGIRREDAAKFSFFMALPAIGGAILYEMPKIMKAGQEGLSLGILSIGFIVCFGVSVACIHFCLTFFRTHSLRVFSVYLICFGAGLLLLEKIS